MKPLSWHYYWTHIWMQFYFFLLSDSFCYIDVHFHHLWIQIFVAIKWLLVIDDKGTYLCPKRKLSNNTLTTNMLGRLGLDIDHFCCIVAFVMNLECNYRFRHTILNKHTLSLSLSLSLSQLYFVKHFFI